MRPANGEYDRCIDRSIRHREAGRATCFFLFMNPMRARMDPVRFAQCSKIVMGIYLSEQVGCRAALIGWYRMCRSRCDSFKECPKPKSAPRDVVQPHLPDLAVL